MAEYIEREAAIAAIRGYKGYFQDCHATDNLMLKMEAEGVISDLDSADVVEMPEGKPGDYLEWDCGMGWTEIYFIHSVNIYSGGEMRYELGRFTPVVNHPNIRRIMNRDEARKELERRCLL